MTDLLAYWNLSERPFEATWDTRFYFQSRDHDEALNRLAYLVGERTMNLGMLTGEVGCGKTLTRAVFMSQLDPGQFAIIVEDTSAFLTKIYLESVLATRGSDSGAGTAETCAVATVWPKPLNACTMKGRHLVLIFDEAQEMSPATMNDLKMLTNLNGGGQNYLTIILLGQPELRSKVVKLPAIDQRISLRFHLNPLNVTEAGAYLVHRLKMAGHSSGDLFASDAVAQLFSACHGVPRELNRLAKLALEVAWLRQMPLVGVPAVDTVIRDLSRHQNLCAA